MIDVNEEALKQAMENVARARFQAELREAIIYGPKILGDLLGEYEKLTGEKHESGQHTDLQQGPR
jgi:hypothetical protein